MTRDPTEIQILAPSPLQAPTTHKTRAPLSSHFPANELNNMLSATMEILKEGSIKRAFSFASDNETTTKKKQEERIVGSSTVAHYAVS